MTWHWSGALLTGLGGSDVAKLVGSLGTGRIDELALVWPQCEH